MEGMARAATRQADLAIATAWNTAVFALNGYAGKLKDKSLADFLSTKNGAPKASKSAEAMAFFASLKSRGFPVEITRH